MSKSARYNLSRLVKGGVLDASKVIEALKNSPSVTSRDFAWTLTDVAEDIVTDEGTTHRYTFGRLAKYDPDALIDIVDESSRSTTQRLEPNMQKAASDFVYLPDSAVFGHRHVWNEIRPSDFRQHVADLIVAFHAGFFVQCAIEPIADLSLFLSKLAQLEKVTELKANVSPPNPLFGMFWSNLDKYLAERRLRSLTIKENAKLNDSVPTQAPEIARRIEAGNVEEGNPAPIGDAAVLMAADGYGRAEVGGTRNGQTIIVKTKDNAISITLPASVTPAELALAVVKEVKRLESKRGLIHK
jgi:hypothetical protein